MNRTLRSLTALGFITLLTACTIPGLDQRSAPGGKVRLSFQTAVSRTVVPDLSTWLSTIDKVTLIFSGGTHLPVDLANASATATLSDLTPGTWTIYAAAYTAGGTVLAGSGETLPFTVTYGSVHSLSIVLEPSHTTGTGGLSLKVSYPDSAQIPIDLTTATLTPRAGQTGGDALSQSSETSAGGQSSVVLAATTLPAGPYSLAVTFTEPTGTRTYRQAINIYNGLTSDKVVDGAGALQNQWLLTSAYFGSSTFLANLELTTTDTAAVPGGVIEGQSFSSPTRTYNLLTQAGSYRVTATEAYSGQTIAYWAGAWVTLPSSTPTGDFNLENPNHQTLTIRVTAPGGAVGFYTVHIQEMGALSLTAVTAPTLEFQGPLVGQSVVRLDQPVEVTGDAGGSTGTWAWLFDGAVVAGEVDESFSILASDLGPSGSHVLTALFETNGFAWAQQFPLTFVEPVDVLLSLRAQKTEVGLTGAQAWAYNSEVGNGDTGHLLTIVLSDPDIVDLWYDTDGTDSPETIHYEAGSSGEPFAINVVGLAPGLHTAYVWAKFADGRIAGVAVPFEIRSRDSVVGLFEVSLPPRFFPEVYELHDGEYYPFEPYWAAEGSTVHALVALPELPPEAVSTILRYTFNGQSTALPVPIPEPEQEPTMALDLATAGIVRGTYTLTLELWSGPSPGARRSLGSFTVVIFLGDMAQ